MFNQGDRVWYRELSAVVIICSKGGSYAVMFVDQDEEPVMEDRCGGRWPAMRIAPEDELRIRQ